MFRFSITKIVAQDKLPPDYEIKPDTPGDKHATKMLGISNTGRMPLGKEKKLFGIELFSDINFASHAKVEEQQSWHHNLKASDVNMINGVIGLSFGFRK